MPTVRDNPAFTTGPTFVGLTLRYLRLFFLYG
jgi:hypothetical protein